MKRIRLYVFVYFTATMLLDVAYRSLDRVARGRDSEWAIVLIEQATGFYGSLLLLPLILWSARTVPFRYRSATSWLWHLGVVIVYSLIHTSWNWGSREVLFKLIWRQTYDYGLMPVRYYMEFPSDVISYGIWMGAYAVYRNWLRSRELENQLMAARMESLSRQLQPHFLFNALNAISGVMYEDVSCADRMLQRLCDFLRSTLRLPESPLVPVSTELALVQQYLDVMQSRLEDRLHFDIECDPNAEASQLPALLLQPLVENAVEHGRDPQSGNLNIDLAVRRDGQIVRITIRDQGSGPSRDTAGKGLQNAHQRLHAAYGDRAALTLSHHPDGGALVEILIPA
jgi:two-component system LytT family sensor kinase